MRSALDELLSRNVRTLMSHTGLTREDLCAALGIGRSTPGTHTCPNHVGEVVSRLLGPGASAHSLRHRYATKAYAASHDLLAVQQLLGHSTPATTQGYVRVDMGDLRRAARAAS